jgi:predicted PurR-regulated permease PerM
MADDEPSNPRSGRSDRAGEREQAAEKNAPGGQVLAEDTPPSPSVPPVTVPRWIQLVLLPLALIGLWELAKAMGSLLVIVAAAATIAMILNPLTKHLQRWMHRGFATVCSYLIVVIIFSLVIAALSAPVSSQVAHFSQHLPSFTRKANRELDDIQKFLNQHGIHAHFVKQGSSALQTIEKKLEKSSGTIVSASTDVLGKIVSLAVDLILTFVLSVYLLVYAGAIGDLVRRCMPPGDGTPDDDYPLLVQRAVSGYVRGQLLFSFVMGLGAAVVSLLLGVTGLFPDGSKYAVFFGLFYGLMELIPYIGPIIGPIPAVLVALFTNPLSAVWVIIAFVLLQELEGHVVAPQIFRISLRINPILVILSLLIGYKIYGIAGALLALPVATVIRQTLLYLRKHLVFEQWPPGSPQL